MSKHTEKIMCIKSEKLFKKGKWQGVKTTDLDYYKKLIIDNQEFRPRNELENDPTYKQVIAQVVLRHENKYYLHRQEDRAETRLNGLSPLPLGGHIEEFDKGTDDAKDIIETALLRELHEEVEMNVEILSKNFLGLVYIEDENPVNSVHIGLVYIFDVDGEDVHIKEEGLKDIGFVSLDFLKKNKETLTYWSRLIIYHL
jgi:predicted NUDIX family phosphoesterase